MRCPTLTTAALGGRAFWYLTRASGVVALVLLSATLVLGVVASVGWTTERWPRFLSQDVHRNISLLGLVFIGIHVATTVLDGYVPIGLVDVFVPFLSPYRPIYVGLGALAVDLVVAVSSRAACGTASAIRRGGSSTGSPISAGPLRSSMLSGPGPTPSSP